MTESTQPEICQRIVQLRKEAAGLRGKSQFAKQLGLSASTYDYYESSRVPPADVLVKIATLAKVDLQWLLTGESSAMVVPSGHPALQRAAKLLAECPDAAEPLSAFLDLLAQSMQFPAKKPKTDSSAQPTEELPSPALPQTHTVSEDTGAVPTESWIPVLGRSAAGVPHFWASRDEQEGITMLGDLIEKHACRTGRQINPAQADVNNQHSAVSVVSLSQPQSDGAVSFVNAAAIKNQYPDAFALQIDGDSMAPEFRHGDLVLLSPSQPASDGKPAVVQLQDQIGVTCKLFRRQEDKVHLVPINEQLAPRSYDASQLVWALRVIGRVRSNPTP